MAETYSLSITGYHASYKAQVPQTVKIPDSAARPGHLSYHASRGNYVLCQNPDGSQSYFAFDAERSSPGNLVMRKV